MTLTLLRSEPGTSDNEMCSKNITEENGKECTTITDETNIFFKMSKEVSKISRPDDKGSHFVYFSILLLHECI